MLFQLAFVLISTIIFFKEAKARGLNPGKVASVPYLALGILLLISFIILRLHAWLASETGSANQVAWLPFGIHLFSLLALVLIVRKQWKQIQQYPRQDQPDDVESLS